MARRKGASMSPLFARGCAAQAVPALREIALSLALRSRKSKSPAGIEWLEDRRLLSAGSVAVALAPTASPVIVSKAAKTVTTTLVHVLVAKPVAVVVKTPSPVIGKQPAPVVATKPAPVIVKKPSPVVVKTPAPVVLK